MNDKLLNFVFPDILCSPVSMFESRYTLLPRLYVRVQIYFAPPVSMFESRYTLLPRLYVRVQIYFAPPSLCSSQDILCSPVSMFESRYTLLPRLYVRVQIYFAPPSLCSGFLPTSLLPSMSKHKVISKNNNGHTQTNIMISTLKNLPSNVTMLPSNVTMLQCYLAMLQC